MILLDTNALLWMYLDDRRLGAEARERIANDSPIFYSAVSVAEITIKNALGKLPRPGGDRFPGVFGEMGLSEMPLNSRQAASMQEVPGLDGHDPFDRLLAAQAYDNRCTLITADRALLTLGLRWIRDARV
ncbi:twitching motility protein PilT [Microbacterium faecale]|uniref:Twitching motility protein PilT n=1 Tax=Microbacterium faecale TaxID=1804630 RepID=A0A917DDD9_9MICO|nr:type II toxin-antitoxin system VapC family toxin [Microbacterium faecale]GGD28980.1 twitching motility protein PilT [Microbacterium faecale]